MPGSPVTGDRSTLRLPRVFAGLLFLALALAPVAGRALMRFDFEQAYFVHHGRQVWDFCLLREEGTYHLFYHTLPEQSPYPAEADTIWHAAGPDPSHLRVLGPVLTSGPGWWDRTAIWAPDVVRDEASGRWAMAYTGVDSLKVQRACLAWSDDLATWTKESLDPVFEPDSLLYDWTPTQAWSAFRDPFLYRDGGLWHMLSTAQVRTPPGGDFSVGAVHHAESPDLLHWSEAGTVLRNEAPDAWHALESSQMTRSGDWYHIWFTEYDVPGTQHVASDSLGNWDWSERSRFDWGNAPEIKSFDPGVSIFGRLAIGQYPLTGEYFYVVRFDTLIYGDGGLRPQLVIPHPLDADWEEHTGPATLGQPTFGDNPAMRGEESCGLVGNGWFGSKEYYQGPLSGRGSPGTALGDGATGTLRSRPFTITGSSIRLLVGGGNYPQTCYVALVDAGTDSILMSETGRDSEFMSLRTWYVAPLRGRLARIVIVDAEEGPFGHINVDEIEESLDTPAGLSPPAATLRDHGPRPNPFNPATEIRFRLSRAARVRLAVHDLRGRLVWRSTVRSLAAGDHGIRWRGRDLAERPVPAGDYLYLIEVEGRRATAGKLTLVK